MLADVRRGVSTTAGGSGAMTPLTHFSLFSGIGGLDLAAEWAGFETVGQVERADYQYRVLQKHWPNVPKWRNIEDVTIHTIREAGIEHAPTVLSGGFPCQPFSCAGQRRGAEDDRYLWPEMLRVVQELRPAWVVGENVAGIINLALDDVLTDLERAGYTCRAFILPAAGVGAPHMRDRCFVVSHSASERCVPGGLPFGADEALPLARIGYPHGSDAVCCGQEWTCVSVRSGQSLETAFDSCGIYESIPDPLCTGWTEFLSPALAGEEGHAPWRADPFGMLWTDEPDVGRVADGIPSRVDRVEALGNAVVPPQAYPIFQAIAAIEMGAVV